MAATAIAAVSPNLWMNDGLVMSESVSMLLVAAALWYALDVASELSRRSLLMLGVTLALGALARSEVVLLIPLVLAWLLYCHRRLGRSAVVQLLPVVAAAGRSLPRGWRSTLPGSSALCCSPPTMGTTILLGVDATAQALMARRSAVGASGALLMISLSNDEEPSLRSARQRSLALQFVRSRTGDLPLVTLARLGRSLDLYGLGDLVRQDVGRSARGGPPGPASSASG